MAGSARLQRAPARPGGADGPQAAAARRAQGEGTFGKVYKGLWRGSVVAVKTVILPAMMSGAEVRGLFKGAGGAGRGAAAACGAEAGHRVSNAPFVGAASPSRRRCSPCLSRGGPAVGHAYGQAALCTVYGNPAQ